MISKNLTLVLTVLFGFTIEFQIEPIRSVAHIGLPVVVVVVIYYAVCALALRSFGFLRFLLITFVVLSFYFDFLDNRALRFDAILQSLDSPRLPLGLYTNVLLPFVFLGSLTDFYSLPKELASVPSHRVLYFFAPILTKRELVRQRYEKILEIMYARGIQTRTLWGRYFSLRYWLVPLFITTLIEGVEGYEYNRMLAADIRIYRPRRTRLRLSNIQRALVMAILTVWLVRIVIL